MKWFRDGLNVLLLSMMGTTFAYAKTTPLLLGVYINQQDTQQIIEVLQTPDQQLWISRKSLMQLNLLLPRTTTPWLYQHQAYYPLHAITGLTYRLDQQTLSLVMTIPPKDFVPENLFAQNNTFITPQPSPFGADFNYDLFGQRVENTTQTSGLFNINAFSPAGVLSSDFLATRQPGLNKTVRLNTTWQTDFPHDMNTLRVGDTYNGTGMWGRAVDFGGIQWSRDFATQPSYITFPLPAIRGEATVPSVVDLYLNNALIGQQALRPGPFTLNAIPVMSGEGTLNVVTTDLLGRQAMINLPYYASSTLLRPGLHNYSFETGFIRNDYGFDSNNYHRFMVVGTDQWGVTSHLTAEWHAEALKDQQTGGVGTNYLIGDFGVLSIAGAASHSHDGNGQLLLLGFQHQSIGKLSYGFQTEIATPHFTQVGLQPGTLPPTVTSQYFIGAPVPLDPHASIGLSYTQQHNRNTPSFNFMTLSYNRPLPDQWSLSISGLSNVGGTNNKAVFLTLSRALGTRRTVNVGGNTQTSDNIRQTQGTVQLIQNLPAGEGYGYNFSGAKGQTNNYQASVSAQNNIGTYTVSAARQFEQQGYQVEAQGSVVMIDKKLYLARHLGDSFALVQVPHYPHVHIYLNNQNIGKTDSHGNLLIPSILPYQPNPIRIETRDLPLDAQIPVKTLNAIPYYQSGIIVRFPVHPTHGALMTLLTATGKPIPAGAQVQLQDNTHHYPVVDAGETYLTNLHHGKNTLAVRWDDHQARCIIFYPISKEPLPNLGNIICNEIKGN